MDGGSSVLCAAGPVFNFHLRYLGGTLAGPVVSGAEDI